MGEANAHDLSYDLYLRIAPQLHLKRLLVGGFIKVFRLGKNYRNEGTDKTHNPEFYWAYANYRDMMKLVKELLSFVVSQIKETRKIT